MRTLAKTEHEAFGVDIKSSLYTRWVGSITERAFVRECMEGIDAVLHAATLHKPHIASHTRQDFVDINVTGTFNLLEEASAPGIKAFVFTSSTSVFGMRSHLRRMHRQRGSRRAWCRSRRTSME